MSSPPELEFRPPPKWHSAVAISIYIYSVYTYILFISKRAWGHYGELIAVKFSKFRMNRDISILFEDLTSVEAPPPTGGWLGGLVGGVRSNH